MQDPVRTAIIGFVSGALGALLILWISGTDEPPTPPPAMEDASRSDLLERIAALEKQATGRSSKPATGLQRNPNKEKSAAKPTPSDRATTQAAEQSQQQRMAEFMRKKQERIEEQLRTAGWSDAEIDSLERLQEVAGLESEQVMYDQMREQYAKYPGFISRLNGSSTLRDSLGEQRYDEYLVATGRHTAMTVSAPLKGSAGEIAGLQEGDLIRRYGSDRIYNENDLMFAVIKGEPGDTIALEVERDGAIFHVSVPRGPLGISQTSRILIGN
jgi:C-terminal processing protease CtpA/Prc